MSSQTTASESRRHVPVLRTASRLVLLGLPGILSLLLMLPDIPGVPAPVLLVNPSILLVVFAFVGSWASPRCGYRSLLAEGWRGGEAGASRWRGLLAAGAVGVAAKLATAVLDHGTAGLWQPGPAVPSLIEGWSPPALVVGVLYGGVVEEIVMRWGLMGLLTWGLWRTAARSHTMPPPAVIAVAAVLSALAFAAGHLPALAAYGTEITAPLLVRTLGLNLLAGLVFAAVFAQRDLESAIASHAGFHLGVAVAAGLFTT